MLYLCSMNRISFHVFALWALLGIVLGGCTTPRAISETSTHSREADSLALKQLMDARLSSWRQQFDSAWSERISQYTNQQQSSEQQHETIQETVTVTLDSLGREMRQEQRTISRDISREQQILEQRLTREYEARLQTAIDSLDASWQSRLDAGETRITEADSTSVTKTPVAQDSRPWYRRWWDHIQWLLIGAVVCFAALLTRKWWTGN